MSETCRSSREHHRVETQELSGKDNEIKVIRYLQRKTYIDEMMTDREE